jgi:hypothetical protein
MHMPTTARFLGIPSKRLRAYLECGIDLAIFSNLKKRHAIWSFDVTMPEGFIND